MIVGGDPVIWSGGVFAPTTALVSVAITGLSSNAQYSNFALVGSQINLTANGGAPDTIFWEITDQGAEYGSALPFTVPGTDDSDDPDNPTLLRYRGTKNGEDFSGTIPIRAALPVNTVAPVLVNSDPTGSDLGDVLTVTAGTWTGAVSTTREISLDTVTVASGATPSHTIVAGDELKTAAASEIATSSGGVVTVAATGGFVVDDFEAPTVGVPAIAGTLEVGQTLTATAGTETGNPTPTGTWQWYRGTTAISGETGATYVLAGADEGRNDIKVRRTLSNALDTVFAERTISGTVTAASAFPTLTISSIGPQGSDGDVDMAYTMSGAASQTYDAVLFDPADGDPTLASQFNGGAADYTDIGQETLTDTGSPATFTFPSGEQGSRRVAFLPVGGAEGDIVVSATFALDTTESVLSPVSFTAGGPTSVDFAFTPDEPSESPVGFRVSVWADGSTPSDAEIESGTGSVATVNGAVDPAAEETGTLTGLVASTTYVPTIYFQDQYGNKFHQTYADVATDASGSTIDLFNRDDEAISADANWSVAEDPSSTEANIGIVSNEVVTTSGNPNAGFYYVGSGASIGADQKVTIKVNLNGANNSALMYLRWNPASGGNGYKLRARGNGRIEFWSVTNGTETELFDTNPAVTWNGDDQAFDDLSFEIVGNDLRVLLNDVFVTGTDVTNSDHASGDGGFGIRRAATGILEIDDFTMEAA